jgi:hypothetical protein
MNGESNLETLVRNMEPVLNAGDYVFCTVEEFPGVSNNDILFFFREKEAITVVVLKEYADAKGWKYNAVFSWISLTIHSSLEAVGLTAAFSAALAKQNISCNVVAAYYHDHIFVKKEDAERAMDALKRLTANFT